MGVFLINDILAVFWFIVSIILFAMYKNSRDSIKMYKNEIRKSTIKQTELVKIIRKIENG